MNKNIYLLLLLSATNMYPIVFGPYCRGLVYTAPTNTITVARYYTCYLPARFAAGWLWLCHI